MNLHLSAEVDYQIKDGVHNETVLKSKYSAQIFLIF